jgi:hypothetical protein
MPDLGGLWTTFVNNPIVQLGVRFAGLYVLALYLAMVFWTVRDAQQRTENAITPYLAGLMVVLLNVLGLFLYLIVRPRETLGEAYERQLAEESLLAEAEQRLVCPTCRERVHEDYILCPTCRTRLKRQCPSCAKLIRPEEHLPVLHEGLRRARLDRARGRQGRDGGRRPRTRARRDGEDQQPLIVSRASHIRSHAPSDSSHDADSGMAGVDAPPRTPAGARTHIALRCELRAP